MEGHTNKKCCHQSWKGMDAGIKSKHKELPGSHHIPRCGKNYSLSLLNVT